MYQGLRHLGIRAKLILLFVVIKVIPLVLLALLAWKGVTSLGSEVVSRNSKMSASMLDKVEHLNGVMSKESVKALDDRSRESIERLTTDTAIAVADFLKGRDDDLLYAATLEPSAAEYEKFLKHKTRMLYEPVQWKLAADKKNWVPVKPVTPKLNLLFSENPENKQDFNYRPPDNLGRKVDRPLYHEITFVGLDGQERLKVSATSLLPRALKNVSDRRNTYAKAENYFAELKNLKPGDIYVSDVIGPYVRSHYYGPVTPEAAEKAKVPFDPKNEAYAGKENPVGKRFQGIIRWAAPVLKEGRIIGYVTLALDHDHVMSFTDNLIPTSSRYTSIPDASIGNYAFIWDYRDRSIAHPRHQSIVGFNPETGAYETPWLDELGYKAWKDSGRPINSFLSTMPIFDHQSRDKKPSKELIREGIRGLDCRYLNFAPQCQGWYDLTKQGGSGSFVILWSGVWKLTTAATIPYYTGKYAKTPRGFGYVTIGANVDEFHKAATDTKVQLDQQVKSYVDQMQRTSEETKNMISGSIRQTALSLALSTSLMVVLVIMIAIWLANLLTRRVTILIEGLQKIEKGDLSYRFERVSDDEMGRLAESINHMADGVEQSFKRVEEARERAEEANRMKSSFLASMSHELRTPLNGILGFAEMLKITLQDEEQRSYAETIHSSGKHLLNIVNDLLDLAKVEAGKMELNPSEQNLRKLMETLVAAHRVHAEEKGLILVEKYDTNLPETICCDPTRFRQVLNNLLNNAIKFTKKGSVELLAEAVDTAVRITVTDTGIGIAPEHQQRIFERFHQVDNFLSREQGGTGLGLSLAKELVTLMGGEMSFTSESGVGSSFSFTVKCNV